MLENPYKFQGPLNPIKDTLVCAPRKDDVDFIIEKISRREYVAIQGPRQIGKTTLLLLVKNQYKSADYAYINFEVTPMKKKAFYQWLVDQLLEKIPCEKSEYNNITGEYPDVSFIDFLKNFRPKREEIILLFDEIDRLNFLKDFLHVWRNLYHESIANVKIPNYNIITTSSMDLLKIPSGPNSPFNITNILNIKDLPGDESEDIIDKPFKKLEIKITPDAKQVLLSQISGHPQLLQHACFLLVKRAKSKMELTETDVDEAIERLKVDNSVLRILNNNINENDALRDLVKRIVKKSKPKRFHPYKDFALLGAGAIKEENSFCKIRNEVFRKYIIEILKNPIKYQNREKGVKEKNTKISIKKKLNTLIILIISSVIAGFMGALATNPIGIIVAGFILSLAILYFVFYSPKE
jgi:hypothetical protein